MENSAQAWNLGSKLLRNCQNSEQNSSCIGGRHIVCTRPNRLMNNWLAMWGYIYFRDLYILAKQFFFFGCGSFFFFEHRKKGYMRSLLGRRGGAWESKPFFLWPYYLFYKWAESLVYSCWSHRDTYSYEISTCYHYWVLRFYLGQKC